jgi:KaiC/GvpD/RAD55 family RecA-like ATPase
LTLLSTGIGQLDEFLGGGLAPGSLIVLLAPPGAGTEILAKQFAAGRAEANGQDDLLLTTEESLDEVGAALETFGFPGRPMVRSLSDEYAKRLMEQERERLEYHRPEALRSLIAADSKDLLESNRSAPLAFLRELLRPYASGSPPKRLTVHSIDFFIGMYGPDPVMNTLTALKMENARLGGIVCLTLNKNAQDSTVETRLATLADCLIELESARRGTQSEKFLHIRKVKNRSVGMGVAPYRITRNGFELDDLDRIL